jgi:hypothetical protein
LKIDPWKTTANAGWRRIGGPTWAGARAKKSLGRGKPRARATARAEALRNSMPWERKLGVRVHFHSKFTYK